MSDLTGTITHSHDPAPPALPPLPEAILLFAELGAKKWETVLGTREKVQTYLSEFGRVSKFATRIITLTPPSARDVSDAEVAAIIREHSDSLSNESDAYILEQAPVSASLVRAALTKGRGA